MHFAAKCHIIKSAQKFHICCVYLRYQFFIHYPRFMTIDEDQNNEIFKIWKVCSVWKIPFHHYKAMKFTQNCVSLANPCIDILVPPSVTWECHRKILEHLDLFQCIAAYLQWALAWVANFHSAWSHAVRTDQVHVEDHGKRMKIVPNTPLKANGWSSNFQKLHIHPIDGLWSWVVKAYIFLGV